MPARNEVFPSIADRRANLDDSTPSSAGVMEWTAGRFG